MKKGMMRAALAVAACVGASGTAHAQMAVVDVRAIAQALQTARNTLQQLQEAQRLYTALNSVSNIRNVANLLDQPILRDALPDGVQDSIQLVSGDLRDLGAIGQRAESILGGQNLTLSGLDSRFGDVQGVLNTAATNAARDQAYGEHMLEATATTGEGLQQLSTGLASATTLRESQDIAARAAIEQAGIANRLLQMQAAQQAAHAQAVLKAQSDFAESQRRTMSDAETGAWRPTWNGQ